MNKKFWKHYRLFFFSMLALIIVTLSILWTYLDAYEKSRPEYFAEKVSLMFQKEKYLKIIDHIDIKGKYNNQSSVQRIMEKELKDGNITYEKKSGLYKNERPVYSILNDGEEIAVLELKVSSLKGLFNTKKWEIKKIDYEFDKQDMTIIAVPDEAILINGIELSNQDLVETEFYYDELSNVLEYVDIKPLVKYEIKDVYQEADVQYLHSKYQKEDNIYSYLYPDDSKLLDELKDFLTEWCKNYTKYVVNESNFYSIAGSVVQGSNAFAFLKTVANTNIWLAAHTPTQFSDFTFKNMQVYASNVFSVEISYDYSFYVNDDLKEYQTDLTLYLINIDGDWPIADLTT